MLIFLSTAELAVPKNEDDSQARLEERFEGARGVRQDLRREIRSEEFVFVLRAKREKCWLT